MWSTSAPGRPAHEHRAGGCERAGCTFDEGEGARQAARCISLGGLLLLPPVRQLFLLLRRPPTLEAEEGSRPSSLDVRTRQPRTDSLVSGLRLDHSRSLE